MHPFETTFQLLISFLTKTETKNQVQNKEISFLGQRHVLSEIDTHVQTVQELVAKKRLWQGPEV